MCCTNRPAQPRQRNELVILNVAVGHDVTNEGNGTEYTGLDLNHGLQDYFCTRKKDPFMLSLSSTLFKHFKHVTRHTTHNIH